MGFFKKGTNELTYRKEIVRDVENKLMVTKGEREWGGGGDKLSLKLTCAHYYI